MRFHTPKIQKHLKAANGAHCTTKPPPSADNAGIVVKSASPPPQRIPAMNAFAQALSSALDRCIATNTVAKQNRPVGFLYREAPVFENDSGWRFFSGDETDEYTDDPDNFSIVSLADITKTNPETAALLSQPEGSAWELAEDGTFQTVADWQPQD